jgi:hypothetical protein
MREYLKQVDAVKVDTALGPIFVAPNGLRGVHINAPHLTVEGVPLQATAFLVSADGLKWSFLQLWDVQTQQSSTAPDTLRARLVDGRDADIIVLGKIAAAIQPSVERLAQTNLGLFLEAERRRLNNEIVGLNQEIEKKRGHLQEREQELAVIEARLPDKS